MNIENLKQLDGFTGTEHYYNSFTGIKYTDGVKFLADNAECYWLIDAIGSYQDKWGDTPFQIWTLTVKEGKATLTMKEDTDQPLLITQEIPFTNFPLEKIELWCIDGVLILPSEY
ncbi:MAG: DUF6876 family protein [Candidatus Izemoplasmatales bacterium]